MNFELPGNESLRGLQELQKLDAEDGRTSVLIDELLKMGARSFVFTGSGEPFLHKNAIEFMARVKHAGCTSIVNTNGTLLNRTMMDELIKMGFNELRINTLAGNGEMYVRTHPGVAETTFDNLRNNLLYLAEKKSALDAKYPKVTLVCIVISHNYNGLVDFAEFASLVKTDRVHYRPVYDIGDRGLSKVVPTKDQAIYITNQLIKVKAYLESKKIVHNINYFLKVFKEQLDTTALYSIIPCYYGWLAVRIDVDGLVYPCCRCYEPLGNIFKNDFGEIWNGNVYRRFRKEAFEINKRRSPVRGCDCNSCPHFFANLRVYRMLHPVKGRSARLKRLCPTFSEEGE